MRLKRAYDEATGHHVERVWQASQSLGLHYIDALHMMSVFRGPTGTGAVTPTPENFDPMRDAEPPPHKYKARSAGRELKSPFKVRARVTGR